jgi:hypothetical protein
MILIHLNNEKSINFYFISINDDKSALILLYCKTMKILKNEQVLLHFLILFVACVDFSKHSYNLF